MYKVSPSGIGSLMECPRCLWLSANENTNRPEGIFPSLPGGFDGLFKTYFDSFRQRSEMPPEIAGKVKGKLFADREKLAHWHRIGKGNARFRTQLVELEVSSRRGMEILREVYGIITGPKPPAHGECEFCF